MENRSRISVARYVIILKMTYKSTFSCLFPIRRLLGKISPMKILITTLILLKVGCLIIIYQVTILTF